MTDTSMSAHHLVVDGIDASSRGTWPTIERIARLRAVGGTSATIPAAAAKRNDEAKPFHGYARRPMEDPPLAL